MRLLLLAALVVAVWADGRSTHHRPGLRRHPAATPTEPHRARFSQESYGAPDEEYGAPDEEYGAPDEEYGAPEESYGAPEESYGAPEKPHSVYRPKQAYRAPATPKPYRAPVTAKPYRAPVTVKPYRAPVTAKPYRAPVTAKPYRAPVTAKPYRAPVTAKPYRAPVTAKPYRAPVTAKPYRAPVTAKPYRAATTTAQSYSAPTTAKPYRAPPTAQSYRAPTTAQSYRAPQVPVHQELSYDAPEVQRSSPTGYRNPHGSRHPDEQRYAIVSQEHVQPGDGSFISSYRTENGITRDDEGEPTLGGEHSAGGYVHQGGWSYVDDEGKTVQVAFVADERGYRPDSAILPTPVPTQYPLPVVPQVYHGEDQYYSPVSYDEGSRYKAPASNGPASPGSYRPPSGSGYSTPAPKTHQSPAASSYEAKEQANYRAPTRSKPRSPATNVYSTAAPAVFKTSRHPDFAAAGPVSSTASPSISRGPARSLVSRKLSPTARTRYRAPLRNQARGTARFQQSAQADYEAPAESYGAPEEEYGAPSPAKSF